MTNGNGTGVMTKREAEWVKKLNDRIIKWFHNQGIRYLGEVYSSGNDIVIHGQFSEVRELEFRFCPGWDSPEKNADNLRLIRFNSINGIQIGELSLVDASLKEALVCFDYSRT